MKAQPTYLYALARHDKSLTEGLSGVDGAAVCEVRHGDLVAVVSALPLAAADPQTWKARLETLDELEALARAHHAVVAAVASRAPTLPFRLASVHIGQERVRDVLCVGYERFQALLDRLAHHVEVGVKVYVEPLTAPIVVQTASPSPGRDYLRQRRRLRTQQQDAYQHASTAAASIDAGLAELAVDRRQLRPHSIRLSEPAGENVLNVAYLVDAARVEQFTDRARSLGDGLAGVRVEVTGPWAAYSFATLEDSSSHGGDTTSGEAP